MPLLTLKRDTPHRAMLRSITIAVDGHDIAGLRYEEEKTIELVPGNHSIVAKMGRTKSTPMSVMIGEKDHSHIRIGCLPVLEAALNAWIPPFICWSLEEIPRSPS